MSTMNPQQSEIGVGGFYYVIDLINQWQNKISAMQKGVIMATNKKIVNKKVKFFA